MLFKLKWTEGTEDKFTYKVNESLKREELKFVRPKGKEVIIKLLAIIQTSKKKNHKLDYTEDRGSPSLPELKCIQTSVAYNKILLLSNNM